jgi:hypothetical protein
MTLLEGSVLPEGLQFLKPGWWLIHVLAFALVFVYGYRKGRKDERREQRAKETRATKGEER